MGYQDEAIQRIIANSEEMAPLQREAIRFGLDTGNQAWQQAQDDRQWSMHGRDQLRGLQDRMVHEANTFNTEQRREELAGQARADVAQSYNMAQAANNRQMQRMGMNPNDGRALAMNNQIAIAQANATANAANKTRQAARLEGLAMTDRASNALAGYPAMGMQAMGAGAGFGVQGLNTANTGLAGLNSGPGMAGHMGAQLGGNASSMWGAQANYHMANKPESFAAGLGSAIGGIGGMYVGGANSMMSGIRGMFG